ncbi:Forkhead-associated domain-containing protein 1, partial [Cuculus canorus]
QDEQLKTFQEEKEFQRQKLQEEIAGYKEQIKQHSLTIVALEDRLREAKQQQKTLEEENAALMEKMEAGIVPAHGLGLKVLCNPNHSMILWFAIAFLRKLREELAAAQSMLLSKEVIIAGLTKELAETRARMSDMRGELSEEQKVELEQNLRQVKCLERELNLLREKLSQMSSLVEKKDQALQRATEELREGSWRDAPRALLLGCAKRPVSFSKAASKLGCSQAGARPNLCFQKPALDLAKLGVKCRGLRHEETIQRQKEGLVELRERIKMLEKKQFSVVMEKGSEPLVVLTKDLPKKIVQETSLKKEPAHVRSVCSTDLALSVQVPNGGSPGAADGADFSEKMYLDVIGALGSLMKVKELSGMQSLKHLPQEEREKAGLQRRKDLELLYDKIRNLKRSLERKEEMLKDYEANVEQLRLSQASLRRCQEEMSKLEDEAYREAEEKALLKEALERTKLQLSQEKRLLQAVKLHKV